MKKIFFFLLCFNLLAISSAYAVCPLCTIAVGVGVGFSHWLGVDDTISGLWIGGFTISLIVWTIDWFNSKNIRFWGKTLLVILLYYGLILFPLYSMHLIGHPLNQLWGVDKLLLGIVLGSVAFYMGYVSYLLMKSHHNHRAYFPFQKVVMPLVPLILLSFLLHVLLQGLI